MEVITLIIAVVALVVAVVAFVRSGGIQDVRRQVEAISSKSESATESMRERTADVFDRLEARIRGQEKPQPEKEQESGGSSTPGDPQ